MILPKNYQNLQKMKVLIISGLEIMLFVERVGEKQEQYESDFGDIALNLDGDY